MSASVGQLVAQLRTIIEAADQVAVQASRAQVDAQTAYGTYRAVGEGSNHPRLRQATNDARTAGEKLGKIARLLGEAANALTDYTNTIAPGSAPARRAGPTGTPSGEQLVEDAERRAKRADAAWRKQVRKADDHQDALTNAENGAKSVFKYYKNASGSSGPGATTTTTQPSPTPPSDKPQVDNPVTAAVMATGAVAVAARSLWRTLKKHRDRKKASGD